MPLPNCPQCNEAYTYEDGHLLVCPMCGHEWTAESQTAADEAGAVCDANGNPLATGDSVTVIRDLKLSAKDVIKQGTKVRNIRLLDEPVNAHDIQAKVDGFGTVYLKSSVVKK